VKNVACLVVVACFGTVVLSIARADDPIDQVPSTSDKLSLQDPDGTPIVITHPQSSSSANQSSAKSKERSAANQDWLLRAYEQQLQQNSADVPGSSSSNLYYRIATDKNLSKLAGVSTIDSLAGGATLKTGVNRGGQGTLSLRPDSSTPAATTSPTKSLLTPLITPLGAADAAGLRNFYGTIPAAPVPKKATIKSGDLDMPGKIAADNNPLTRDSLTFDSLPDDTGSSKSSHHDSISKTELPLSSNAAQVQKLTDASLTAKGSTRTNAPVNVSAMQLKLVEDPPPPKLVVPNSGRQPIANPYSILDH